MRCRSLGDRLIEVIQSEQIELLNAFGLFHQRGMLAAYASAKCGIPYMLSFRGSDLEIRIFGDMLQQLHVAIEGASALICASRDSAQLLGRMFRPSAPISVIRNHFVSHGFQDLPVRVEALDTSTAPVIGCFGKFRRVTGLDFLLRAVEQVSRIRPVVLLLGGTFSGKEAHYYETLLASLETHTRVIRLGHIEHSHVLNYMHLCDVLVYPSIADASPNKILEAMYAKVPIVSTLVGGIPELVRDGKEALLVPPRTVEPLAEAICKLLDDPPLREQLTSRAFERVTTEFSVTNERPQWVKVYTEALEGSGPPGS